MSVHAIDQVWKHSKQKGTSLLLLLAIADHAHDDGGGAYPSVNKLAQKIRMSERQTQRLLHQLAETDELEIDWNGGPNRCHLFRVTCCQGDTPALEEGDIVMSPKPSKEPSGPSVPSETSDEVSSVTAGTRPKRKTQVTEAFMARMRSKYPSLDVDELILDAIGHKNYLRWDDKQRYVENWLKREINGSRASPPARREETPEEWEKRHEAEEQEKFRRVREEMDAIAGRSAPTAEEPFG